MLNQIKGFFPPYSFMSIGHVDITPISTFCHFACKFYLWYRFSIQVLGFFFGLTALRQALTLNI